MAEEGKDSGGSSGSFKRLSGRELDHKLIEFNRKKAEEHLRKANEVLEFKPLGLPLEGERKVHVVGELSETFKSIKGEPVRDGNPYFIEDPDPWGPPLTEEFEQIKPFFVEVSPEGAKTNKEVAPFVWEDIAKSERFLNAEKYTNNDSGLFALCAVSAETPKEQAYLYSGVADSILKLHESNPELLEQWFLKQGEGNLRGKLDSINVFIANEFNQENGSLKLRPERERLLALSNGTIDYDIFNAMWQGRIRELREFLKQGILWEDHLRWIEFLSHSVNISKVFEFLKQK